MDYKAIFFDRDGTLTTNDFAWESLRNEKLSEWSGQPFEFSYEFFERNYKKVLHGGYDFVPYKNLEQELKFFKQWYIFVFEELGIKDNLEKRADFLVEHLWYLKKELYPETVEVLEYFKDKGYKMGVISNCPPSLEMTLINCGIAKYFTSFTASSLIGVGKPSPIIFNAALNAQGVKANESLYVDDYDIEADGAREQGFTSFLIDRNNKQSGEWVIRDLKKIVEFVEKL